MYYVNIEQITARLDAVAGLSEAITELERSWKGSALEGLAQERVLHLAIEIVTDVGNYLIDGFIMRDASSYEDIIEITGEAGVYPPEMLPVLTELVKLRRPLVQDYYDWPRHTLHPLTSQLAKLLLTYKSAVEQYLERELL